MYIYCIVFIFEFIMFYTKIDIYSKQLPDSSLKDLYYKIYTFAIT